MKKFNLFLIIFLSLLSCYCITIYGKWFSSLSIPLVLFIPRIASKLFKIEISPKIEFIYIVFIFLVHFLGCVVGLYNLVWWYDLFAHFLSGILTSILALLVLSWFKMLKEKKKWFNLLFMNCFSLAIASLWEFLEFLAFVLFNMDVQHHLTTGVFDTMEDMMIAFLGNLLVCVVYFFQVKRKKKTIH